VVEDEAVVEQRLHRALEVLPKEVIWVDPDCGLKTRTVNEAIAKMQSVVTAAKALRKNSDE
jgi:5-methyltetrahydropteroyltriglutamate--homocysteine methyltransferase